MTIGKTNSTVSHFTIRIKYLFKLQKQLNEAEDEAESNSDAHNDELEMHAKLLKESKNSRDALKRLKNWLGENFNKPLIRK